MANHENWQEALSLTDRVLAAVSSVDLAPRRERWRIFLAITLNQANERLAATRLLLEASFRDSGTIVTRSLFELAVNVVFIAKDIDTRLDEYLHHGQIPLTEEEAEEALRAADAGETESMPRAAWRPLRSMCEDLGTGWVNEYDTHYAYASVVTHAGSFTFGRHLHRLISGEEPTDEERAGILVTALAFQLRVAATVSLEFPESIPPADIDGFRGRCLELGARLGAR